MRRGINTGFKNTGSSATVLHMEAGRAFSGPGAPGRLRPSERCSARVRGAERGGVQGKRGGNMASDSVWQGKMRRVSRQLTQIPGLRPLLLPWCSMLSHTDSGLLRNTRNPTGCSSRPHNPYFPLLP